ncbi:ABC-type dipeptide/oligopeptide transport system, ATPase component [Thermococcus onnurineus NA1]|uniref:ABC-type dipeptide/oligopeptide transport system, ATPase component n=1 Tax=Thermococcus onnurineus (strain NA1) TaxID=523850 RepID=B6YV29_THEON|nr:MULTISPECIES: ABC transporter ATP-binding protein [Thermococcus]ACJ17257.1 ABC-type dipeptide/oligopeptide transport system, ATPase component [Thermococcus onnurineus NA1]NJE46002.1 ABC transporter ATP-binding protein [Thermococcus sp. GR7]NJE78495.1 ABC transporter ATP-binding protein [Thermococcus sp. GR4]NJF22198.1 ABC transporter ATP-binding protein [Thermococcus sp. GR5]
MAKNVLEVKDLKMYYFTSKGVVKAVDNITFNLKKGEVLGLAGESGCGKSSLGFTLMGMPTSPGKIVSGSIKIDGREIVGLPEDVLRKEIRWQKISMIFQGAMNALNPVYTIGYQMTEPLILHKGMDKDDALDRAQKYLELVGLPPDIVYRYPHELSGGMKQRVIIATALLLEPDVVIADEPTTALDVVVQAQIINLMKKLKKELGLSMIFITHDLSILAEISDRVAIMYAGKIIEIGDSEKIYYEPAHPYTQKLLAAIPRLHEDVERLEFIPGQPPNLITPPKGCRFHPRCPYAMQVCKEQEPELKEIDKDHYAACWLL